MRLELRSLHKVRISERATSWSISTSPLVGAELGCVSWACQSHKELTDKDKTHLETHCCKCHVLGPSQKGESHPCPLLPALHPSRYWDVTLLLILLEIPTLFPRLGNCC